MDVEFDPAKDAKNRAKHGYGLLLGSVILEHVVEDDVEWIDGEERITAFGFVGVILFACVYTVRRGRPRIVSVRKATREEQRECRL